MSRVIRGRCSFGDWDMAANYSAQKADAPSVNPILTPSFLKSAHLDYEDAGIATQR
jgi:hypothetical protein